MLETLTKISFPFVHKIFANDKGQINNVVLNSQEIRYRNQNRYHQTIGKILAGQIKHDNTFTPPFLRQLLKKRQQTKYCHLKLIRPLE